MEIDQAAAAAADMMYVTATNMTAFLPRAGTKITFRMFSRLKRTAAKLGETSDDGRLYVSINKYFLEVPGQETKISTGDIHF